MRWPCPAPLRLAQKTLNPSSSARSKRRAAAAPRRRRRRSARIRVFRSACGSARSRPWSTNATAAWASRCISAAQGLGEHGGFLAGGGARDGRQGLQHRPLHRRGCLRGPGGCGADGALAAHLDLAHPWNVTPTARSRSPKPARPRRWPSTRASTTPRAHRSAPTRGCMSTATRTDSSAAIPPPRTP
jgi:hypothetical protein